MAKVFVGLSGGVDSAVSAYLLIKEGHEVVPVFIKNWTSKIGNFNCASEDDFNSAAEVAAFLKLDLKVYDFEKQYKQEVIGQMIEGYSNGRTPNPDIYCNKLIKFKLFLNKALEDGADYIATGHYSVVKDGKLFKAHDNKKDQSYFLCRIDRDSLKKVIFPLGYMTKIEVRKLASKIGLPNSSRPDSQGLCFVGDISLKQFLLQYLKPKSGEIIEEVSNSVLGKHDGYYFYTIGQRRSLNLGGNSKPYFVTKIDSKNNRIFVSDDEELLLSDSLLFKDLYLFNNNVDLNDCYVKLRYRAKAIKIDKIEDNKIYLAEKERAITPGQFIAFYDKDELVASAEIA